MQQVCISQNTEFILNLFEEAKGVEMSQAIANVNGGAGRIRTADKGFADLCLSHLATAP